jgi:hypothetical protein
VAVLPLNTGAPGSCVSGGVVVVGPVTAPLLLSLPSPPPPQAASNYAISHPASDRRHLSMMRSYAMAGV